MPLIGDGTLADSTAIDRGANCSQDLAGRDGSRLFSPDDFYGGAEARPSGWAIRIRYAYSSRRPGFEDRHHSHFTERFRRPTYPGRRLRAVRVRTAVGHELLNAGREVRGRGFLLGIATGQKIRIRGLTRVLGAQGTAIRPSLGVRLAAAKASRKPAFRTDHWLIEWRQGRRPARLACFE